MVTLQSAQNVCFATALERVRHALVRELSAILCASCLVRLHVLLLGHPLDHVGLRLNVCSTGVHLRILAAKQVIVTAVRWQSAQFLVSVVCNRLCNVCPRAILNVVSRLLL